MRGDEIGERAVAQRGGAQAEELLGRGVDQADFAAAVDDDHRVGKRGQHRGGVGLGLGNRARMGAAPPEGRLHHAACRAKSGS